jgi:heme exporter protein C
MAFVKKYWWKIITAMILSYVIVGGLLTPVPNLPLLNESARNLFFHVPMWQSMQVCFFLSAIFAIVYLKTENNKYDLISTSFVETGFYFGLMGLSTGMLWASGTWGKAFPNDPKIWGATLTLLAYAAYLILRLSITNQKQVARISAVYNIFALALIVPALYIIPARMDGLHPGSAEDETLSALRGQSNVFAHIFYPAMLGWVMLSLWLFDIRYRLKKLKKHEIK